MLLEADGCRAFRFLSFVWGRRAVMLKRSGFLQDAIRGELEVRLNVFYLKDHGT